jgi:hypothetical protein
MTTVGCSNGVYDCSYRDVPAGSDCANYDQAFINMEGNVWIVVLSGFVMCVMAFGMGSNDAGNINMTELN